MLKIIINKYLINLERHYVTGTARDFQIKPHLAFNTLGGGFNFKNADWDHFSNLIGEAARNLERDAKRCIGRDRVDKLTT
jgi:hypothetical protein